MKRFWRRLTALCTAAVLLCGTVCAAAEIESPWLVQRKNYGYESVTIAGDAASFAFEAAKPVQKLTLTFLGDTTLSTGNGVAPVPETREEEVLAVRPGSTVEVEELQSGALNAVFYRRTERSYTRTESRKVESGSLESWFADADLVRVCYDWGAHGVFRYVCVVPDGEDVPHLTQTPFTDVAADAYYADAVAWAVEQHITLGTTETTFSPANTTTRGNVATFLWRWAGETQPGDGVKDFSDVGKKRYCYSSVLWAVERGVTLGTTETTFSPDSLCTYAHVLTFLWRFMGSPEPAGTGTLAGTYEGRYFRNAVEWAEEQGLLRDCLADFSPSNPCPRADVVQFLYRIGRRSAAECVEGFADTMLSGTLTADMVKQADLWTYGTWNDRPGEHGRLINPPEELLKTLIWVVYAETPFNVGGLPHGGPMRNARVSLVIDARTGTILETGYAPGAAAETEAA